MDCLYQPPSPQLRTLKEEEEESNEILISEDEMDVTHTAAMASNTRPMHDPAWIGKGLPRSLVEDLLATDGC